MIEPHLLAGFIAAVIVLMLIPGPNVALIVAGSIAHGPRHGLVTVAGTVAAQALTLGLVALGITELMGGLGPWFDTLRWLGAAYLVWLGIAQWRAPVRDIAARPLPQSVAANFVRAFFVSLVNPKTLIFYTVFLPQFLVLNDSIGRQMALLSCVFLALALLIDSGWALAAGSARTLLARQGRFSNRLSGGILAGAGVVLALVHHS